MAKKNRNKGSIQYNILYTVITAVLLSVTFFVMVSYLYNKAENEAYETLHVQTKQVKDDLVLQLVSDRENLSTMASFATKLYKDGGDYSLLFESFKPVGMIENIGILNRDNTFSTKAGTTDMTGILSFEEEKEKGMYISGKIEDVTKKGYELIRSAVPIVADNEVVGILYGAIKPDKLGARYISIVEELDAQLFVYEIGSGKILIDTVQDELENISFLKDREYDKGYSYEQFISTDKGFTAFKSAYKNEILHMHYSTIEEFGWMIAMGRYDSEVLASAHARATVFTLVYLIMLLIIIFYILVLMVNEKKIRNIAECASNIRKKLLETMEEEDSIEKALVEICYFAKSSSAIFFDTDGKFYQYIMPKYKETMLSENDRIYLKRKLFYYASKFHRINKNTVNVMCIKPNNEMKKSKPSFYRFLKNHKIKEISLSATISNSYHITILATINSRYGDRTRKLAEKVSACFSMALYHKEHLDKTMLTATTDALTRVMNRAAFNSELNSFEGYQYTDFSCVYVDVNELHLCNNKYGHAAGDKMLVFIANILKEIFFGYNIYRIGGDEFLIFCNNLDQNSVESKIELLHQQLKTKNYHVATGLSFRAKNPDAEEMIKEAEKKMYEAKSQYYQNKDQDEALSLRNSEYIQLKTGSIEMDAVLSVLKEKYNGIYRVSLSTDEAKRILMPAYLNYKEDEEHFSKLYSKYVENSVDSDCHRATLSFLNYEVLKKQLDEGNIPKITFKKNNGEHVALSVYKISEEHDSVYDTLWVFAKA